MRRNRGRTGTSPCHFIANSGDPTADTVFAHDTWIDILPRQSNGQSAPTFRAASVVSEEHPSALSIISMLGCRLFPILSLRVSASLCQFHPLTCPPIDTFPSFDSAVLEIGPGGAVYAGPIGEAAKLWRER
jgi:hypothetical protein